MRPVRFAGSTDPRDLSAPRNALSENLRVFGAEFSGVATKHPSNRLTDHRLDYRVFRNPRRSALVRHRGLSHHVDGMFAADSCWNLAKPNQGFSRKRFS